MTISLFGINNCDTCRKARRWLDDKGIEYQWHDIRKDGLTAEQLQRWLDGVGSHSLINRRGPSWRKLDPDEQKGLNDGEIALFLANPTVIKRPILERNRTISVGFRDSEWQERFQA
ncbi:arsenate reductase [Natronospira proteinivora]|uniref:Arsenate reductase n=1 Tax=Natronospira proteinivora TaxID=1807133 RepID=A0ABT1G5N1_9GAMM|nr:Spx/MgsR family RNA polymerase-binding regulatory protein [Natronospira proteinivora]MCP1726611.1 arsenate reductase [Natronospira proteinivora]